MNLGLRDYEQLIVLPAYYVFYTVFSILGGMFFFDEVDQFTKQGAVMFPLATGLLLLLLSLPPLSINKHLLAHFTCTQLVVTFWGTYFITTQPKRTDGSSDPTTPILSQPVNAVNADIYVLNGIEPETLVDEVDPEHDHKQSAGHGSVDMTSPPTSPPAPVSDHRYQALDP